MICNLCKHFQLTCVEIRSCFKLQQFCCPCNSTLLALLHRKKQRKFMSVSVSNTRQYLAVKVRRVNNTCIQANKISQLYLSATEYNTTHANISHLVASLPTTRQQVVFALLVPSCQQGWIKLLLEFVSTLLILSCLLQGCSNKSDGLMI